MGRLDRHSRGARARLRPARSFRVYGRDVAERLARGGMTVQLVPYAQQLPAELAFRYHLPERGVAPGGDIYRCTA